MSAQSRITPDRTVLAGLLLVAAVYCRGLSYDFILDDIPLILMNETLTSWHNWKAALSTHIFSAFGLVPAVHYRPVYMLWLMLNYQLFGGVVPWWHLTSLLLHIGVTLLVYQLGLRLLKDPWTSALGALLFGLHPIHVESVTYVSASTDLLVGLFALVAFLSYFRFREEADSPAYLVISLCAAALAMLSKETGAMFPWMLVAYEALRQDPAGADRNWRRFVWTFPFFALVGAYAAVRALLFGRNLTPGGMHLSDFLDIPIIMVAYVRNLLWPIRLSFYYPVEWASQWTLIRAAAVVLVMASAICLWIRYRHRPELKLLILWTAILLVPPLAGVFMFAKEDWIHDRHMYLASIPFCLIVAAWLRDSNLPKRASVLASSFILVILLCETAVQLPRFRDDLSIYQSTLKVAPRSAIARSHYADALWGHGHHDEALLEYRLTTELSPDSPVFHANYAGALALAGRDDEATAQYAKALQWAARPTPLRAAVLYGLATIEVNHSRPLEGADHMREALQIDSQVPGYHAMLAQALHLEGRSQEAEREMQLESSVQEQSNPRQFKPEQ